MSADLIFPVGKAISFRDALQHTRTILLDLLKLQSVPPLLSELSPNPARSATTLAESLIGGDFPGAYIRFEGDDESTVGLQVFKGGRGGKELLVGVGTVSTPASDVLAAAIAVAVTWLMSTTMIGDYGHHWIDKDDCTAQELVGTLALQEPQRDFKDAVRLVHSRQASAKRLIQN